MFLGFIFQSPLLRSIVRSGILKYRNLGGRRWFSKGKFLQVFAGEEKNCMQHKWKNKKIVALLLERKTNAKKLFHHSDSFTNSQRTCNHYSLAPFFMIPVFFFLVSFPRSENDYLKENQWLGSGLFSQRKAQETRSHYFYVQL